MHVRRGFTGNTRLALTRCARAARSEFCCCLAPSCALVHIVSSRRGGVYTTTYIARLTEEELQLPHGPHLKPAAPVAAREATWLPKQARWGRIRKRGGSFWARSSPNPVSSVRPKAARVTVASPHCIWLGCISFGNGPESRADATLARDPITGGWSPSTY